MSLIVNTELGKRKQITIDGSKLFYHELGYEHLAALNRKHATRGDDLTEEEQIQLSISAMEEMVDGWDNVLDSKGNPVPFDKKYVRGLSVKGITQFFIKVLTPMLKKGGLIEGETDDERKNS